jgi:hypothetical protein
VERIDVDVDVDVDVDIKNIDKHGVRLDVSRS